MKSNILSFLLGIMFIILISATTNTNLRELLTVKPATPKSTVVLSGTSVSNWKKYVKEGYQFHLISEGSAGRQTFILVKY